MVFVKEENVLEAVNADGVLAWELDVVAGSTYAVNGALLVYDEGTLSFYV